MEETIQFIANTKGWVSIKKMKITEQTDPKSIMEFLASLGTGLDRKVEDSLGKIVEIEKLNIVLNEVLNETGKNAGEIIQAMNSRKISAIVNELVEQDKWQTGEKKEVGEFLKVFAMRKALKTVNVRVDYSEIKIPGMKKPKKVKG
ncbi:MAG: hypothetical protein COT90_03450 [Candidatus Diapherotrites archaeon CG10_big_fil_rev_8_21_14_0_10_31_34]|nr:MAG: hypothetical protein COT90_03450 [Candidatus Diapherotrites archaeon CG10_big_fil_rev_8_21_14_0_10_31_34]